MDIRFWGARGTIPSSGPAMLRYGGNTACVEVNCGRRRLILDGGSGLRLLGDALSIGDAPVEADILFSHFHIDHVLGLPLFLPAYTAGNRFRLWGCREVTGGSLRNTIRHLMGSPLFPVELDAFKADLEFRDFKSGETLQVHSDVRVRTAPLNHPGGAVGYRIEHAGKVLAYITDTEHRSSGLDDNVLTLARNADLMIYDATYTEEEYAERRGWGHSTWLHGVELAQAADARILALFHHDPSHDDEFLDRLAASASAARKDTIVVREGVAMML